MPRIEASKALYIKLGEGGKYAERCVERDQTVYMDFRPISHSLCREGRWDEVLEEAKVDYENSTYVMNQLKTFYETPDDVLWITFHRGALWWCRSRRDVTLEQPRDEFNRVRQVIGSWERLPLALDRLSGKLTMLQRYQGTLCSLRQAQLTYLVQKINGEQNKEAAAAEQARSSLESALHNIIRDLPWRDFELLVDLIFTNAGWKRVSEVGKVQKTVDLILDAPIIGRRYGVQIKSQADGRAFEAYKSEIEGRPEPKHYFVVHSPNPALAELAERMTEEEKEKVEILGPGQLAEWSVRYGLIDWIIDKAG
jgi:hypothetical protein